MWILTPFLLFQSPSRPEENVFRENELLDTDENGKVNWQPDEDEKNCDGDEEMDEDEPGLEQSDEEGHFSPDEDQEPNGKKAFNVSIAIQIIQCYA